MREHHFECKGIDTIPTSTEIAQALLFQFEKTAHQTLVDFICNSQLVACTHTWTGSTHVIDNQARAKILVKESRMAHPEWLKLNELLQNTTPLYAGVLSEPASFFGLVPRHEFPKFFLSFVVELVSTPGNTPARADLGSVLGSARGAHLKTKSFA